MALVHEGESRSMHRSWLCLRVSVLETVLSLSVSFLTLPGPRWASRRRCIRQSAILNLPVVILQAHL